VFSDKSVTSIELLEFGQESGGNVAGALERSEEGLDGFLQTLRSLRAVAGRSCPVGPKRSSESTFSMMSSDSAMVRSSSGMLKIGAIFLPMSLVGIGISSLGKNMQLYLTFLIPNASRTLTQNGQ